MRKIFIFHFHPHYFSFSPLPFFPHFLFNKSLEMLILDNFDIRIPKFCLGPMQRHM